MLLFCALLYMYGKLFYLGFDAKSEESCKKKLKNVESIESLTLLI